MNPSINKRHGFGYKTHAYIFQNLAELTSLFILYLRHLTIGIPPVPKLSQDVSKGQANSY